MAFMIYAFGLTTFSLEAFLVHSFFALSDTKTPVKYGILCVFMDIALAIALLKPFGYLGIAGAFVISKTVKIVILGTLLNKRLKGLFSLQIMSFSSKLAVTTCAVWVSIKLLLGIDNSESLLHTFSCDLILPGTGALLTFIACSYLLRIDEFRALVSLLKHRKAGVRVLCGEFK
jgi:putative peptidoglycan lipid II flippase